MTATALQPGVTTKTPVSTTTAVAGSERPDFKTPAYQRMEVRWTKCRLLMSGTQAMRDADEDVLPRFEAEDDDAAYEERKNRAALFNGFARTVLASVGLLLQIEPVLGNDMDPALVAMWENIDAAGTHGRVFARDLTLDAVVDGHDGILVDMPRRTPATPALATPAAPVITAYADPVPAGVSAAALVPGAALDSADQQALGLRPYFVQYKADDVFRATYATRNGRRQLVLLVLREVVDEQVSLLAYRTIVRYRIYTYTAGKVMCQVWQAPDGSMGIPSLKEGPFEIKNVSGIPWAPLRAGVRISDSETKPPLEDLADLNIEHHQTKTNILNLESLAMVPTPVRIGATRDADGNYPPIVFGPRSTIEAPHIEGVVTPMYWLSPPVDVLAPAQETLSKTEAAMGAAGMAFLAPQTRSAETAQAREIDSRAQNASLAMVGQALQDCLEAAFGWAAQMLGLKTTGSVTISTDYEAALMEPQAMLAYAKLVEMGFPKMLALEALQAGGRIDADADLQQVAEDWDGEMAAAQQNKLDEMAAQTALAQSRMSAGGQPKPLAKKEPVPPAGA